MTKFYVTQDNDGSYINENADIFAFDTEAEARAYLEQGFRHALDDGDKLSIEEGYFSDCWIRAHSDPDKGGYLDHSPFDRDDLIIRKPGTHPGGNQYWIEPNVTVLVGVLSEGPVDQ